MDSLLADIQIDDPTAEPPEDVVMADGVTAAAVDTRQSGASESCLCQHSEGLRCSDDLTNLIGAKRIYA